MIELVNTKSSPAAVGPYSQAVKFENLIFVSGQLPLNPSTGRIESENVVSQTKQVLENVENILKSQGLTKGNIIKTTIFLKDLSKFEVVNEEYSNFFNNHRPARSCVEVSELPKQAEVEIEVIASTN